MHLKEGKKALDVGSGSGYLTVCMARMVSMLLKNSLFNIYAMFCIKFSLLKHCLLISALYRGSLIYLQLLQVGETGLAVGIDHIDDLVAESIENVKKSDGHFLDSGRLKLVGS